MSKHIELVKKWLDDPDSVTKEKLKANADAAAADADAAAAYAAAAAWAADAAAEAAEAADAAAFSDTADYVEHYVKKYEELTGE